MRLQYLLFRVKMEVGGGWRKSKWGSNQNPEILSEGFFENFLTIKCIVGMQVSSLPASRR